MVETTVPALEQRSTGLEFLRKDRTSLDQRPQMRAMEDRRWFHDIDLRNAFGAHPLHGTTCKSNCGRFVVKHEADRCASPTFVAPTAERRRQRISDMLSFRRDATRHRIRFTAETMLLRYEIELLGQRWFVRSVHRGALRAVGQPSGFLSYELAQAAAAADAARAAR
jgi:hypothetical protein